MNNFTKFLIGTVTVLLIGCTTTDHIYSANGQCITCFNNPLTGESLNYEASEATNSNSYQTKTIETEENKEPTSNKYCHNRIKYNQDIPLGVDVAYIRYKRSFGFMTKNEKIRARGLDPATANPLYTIMDSGFRHVVVPSVRYQMVDSVDLEGQQNAGWLSVELENAGKDKARIFVGYCEGGIDGFDQKFTSIIKHRIETGYL